MMQAAYVEAQKVWRDSRCVIVTAPDYIPESAFANNNKPTHTEEVAEGQLDPVPGRPRPSVQADGRGEDHGPRSTARSRSTPDTSRRRPGSLTYVAPNEDGQDGIVKLESVSKQGIGRLKLTFHTGRRSSR